MGTNPVIRLKGMSRMLYLFEWDKDIRHYAYEPKNQREADDIYRTQGKLYHTIYFSAWIDDKKEEKVEEPAPKPKKKRGRPKKAVVA